MCRFTLQILLLVFLASLCLCGYLLGRHILNLPFRHTNDALHQRGSDFTLDFLIPAGTYLNEKITIGEVIKIRFKREKSIYEKVMRAISELIPARYRFVADMAIFFLWFFCFMTFIRIFTFIGYSRSLRTSLLLAGITYYFMPDFSTGKGDDLLFILFPLFIIAFRAYLQWRRKKKKEVLIK